MAMMSLRGEESVIVARSSSEEALYTERQRASSQGRRGLRIRVPQRGSYQGGTVSYQGGTVSYQEGTVSYQGIALAMPQCFGTSCPFRGWTLGPRLGHVGLFLWSDLQQRLAPNMHKAQFARREQGMDGFFHPRSRHEVREKVLDLSLLHGNNAAQIFRDQRGKRFVHRNSDAFPHDIGRPA